MSGVLPEADDLYDHDVHAWAKRQVSLLKARASRGDADGIDWANIIEEIDSCGRAERREVQRLLGDVLLQLMKWRVLEGFRSGSIKCGIRAERMRLSRQLRENPSLRSGMFEMVEWEYGLTRLRMVAETGLPESMSPPECPLTIAQILDEHFYPEAET